ncbi:hypothetical protein [Oricola sp.]|uniref:hypothetical protein n=1 Tax=Oricola sp. TaxID=1979950 RepID=UPI003BAC4719
MAAIDVRASGIALPILACFGGGSLYGWSGYLPAVQAAYGLSYASVSMVFSLAIASFTLGVLFGPAVIARLPGEVRLAALAAAALVCLLVASLSPTFPLFVAAYGAGFGAISGAIYNHALSEASKKLRATLFVPVTVAAFGLGGALFGPLANWLGAGGWGLWSTAPAALCLAVTAALSFAIRPAHHRDRAEGGEPSAGLSFPERNGVAMWAIFACGSLSGLVVLGFSAQILSTSATPALAGLAIFLAAAGNTLGRLAAAPMARLLAPASAVAMALAITGAAVACLIFAEGHGAAVAFLFLAAFGYGNLASNMPLLVKARLGVAGFSAAFGWVFTGWGVAGLAGPWGAGYILDVTGGFRLVLVACLAASLIGLLLSLRLR